MFQIDPSSDRSLVTQIVAGYYDDVSRAGGSRWDTSSLITRL